MATAFPFSAIVGQDEMKLALLIAAVDPKVGGVLAFGDRGAGKSTAVRALAALLPKMKVVSRCRYNCDPDHPEQFCSECRARASQGALKSVQVSVPVVDLPLGATEDRVVGALDLERALTRGEKAFEPGLLARAHRGFLYIDEANLLEDHLVDLLLDVAASGENVVERDGLSIRHPARFVLVGTGNPEEGELRPQLLDRFGMSVEVRTPDNLAHRIEVVKRRDAFEQDNEGFASAWAKHETKLRKKITTARERLPSVTVPDAALERAASLCMALGTDGLRGELTLMRAARSLAAFEGDTNVTDAHLKRIAPPALRHRLRRNPLDDAGSSVRVDRAVAEIFRMSAARWTDAVTAAQLLAVDPVGTGLLLRARAGPVRERLLATIRATLPPGQPLKHLPLHIADSRLLGGLDLNATLRAGRPIAERGLLAEADGGVLIVAMAERLPSATTVHVTAAQDSGEVRVERDGLSLCLPARFGVVALDEGLDDEFAPAALRDRLAIHLDLDDIAAGDAEEFGLEPGDIDTARRRLRAIAVSGDHIASLCKASAALGIPSLRAPLLAISVARASAAWNGNAEVGDDDIALAARLVLAPRALVFPEQQEAEPEQHSQPETESLPESERDNATDPNIDRALDEVILAAVQAAIPEGVLAALRESSGTVRARSSGKSGAMQKSGRRGRPNGIQRGELRAGAKLNVIETLRAAAPWQPLRRRETSASATQPNIIVRKDDLRISRFRQRGETATIFVVDASGSAALHRLAEAKGAVELLLADCYVRRDQVALIAFRGTLADVLLPPTRSLTRAKRSLAGLPGGGGTPLAAGLDAAFQMAESVRRKGQTPTVVVLTDGRANIARDGAQGRAQAEQDATSAARQLRAAGIASVLVDMSPRPGPQAEVVAREMGARYLPLPYADATMLSRAVRASMQ